MNKSLDWIEKDLTHIRDRKLYRALTELGTGQSPEITIDRKRYILLASNGYLGLSVDPRVFERIEEGATIRATVDDLAELERAGATVQRRVETAVLDLLAGG